MTWLSIQWAVLLILKEVTWNDVGVNSVDIFTDSKGSYSK